MSALVIYRALLRGRRERGCMIAGTTSSHPVVCRPAVRLFFFFQAEDGLRDGTVTGVQTCALPISVPVVVDLLLGLAVDLQRDGLAERELRAPVDADEAVAVELELDRHDHAGLTRAGLRVEIGRASCRERVEISGGGGSLEGKGVAE